MSPQRKGGAGPGIEDSIVVFGPFRFDRRALVLSKNGSDLAVQPKPLAVLRCLVDRPGEVFLKDELLDAVWQDAAVTENSLAEAVRMLRQALGDDPKSATYIETVHRRGYRFIGRVRPAGPVRDTHVGEHPAEPARNAYGGEKPAVNETTNAGRSPAGPSHGAADARARWYAGVGAFLAGGAVVAAAIWLMPAAAPTGPRTAFFLEPPAGASFWSPPQGLAISPDGNLVAFVATENDRTGLFTRRLDDLDVRNIGATLARDASQPFFSPDGRRIAYLNRESAGVEIYDLKTGDIEVVCRQCIVPGGQAGGVTLGPDGSVVFAHAGTLWRLEAVPGEPERLPTEGDESPAHGYWWPSFLPGGEWLLVTMLHGHDIGGAQLGAYHMATGTIRPLINDAVSGRYVPISGHLVFAREGDLWSVSFDPDSLQVTGEPARIDSRGLWMSGRNGFAGFAVSSNGVLIYHPGSLYEQQDRIRSIDRTGNAEDLIDDRGLYISARPSPDGRRLAVCRRATTDEIRVYEVDTQRFVRFADSSVDLCDPVWSPDGRRIAYTRERRELAVRGFGVLDPPEVLVRSDSYLQPMDWTASGEIVYLVAGEGSGIDIRAFDVATKQTRPLVATERSETVPRVSPDGEWLAYSVDWEVKVAPFPEGGTGTTVGAGIAPRWAPDGSELYYYRPDSGWMVMPLQEGEDPFSGPPSSLPIRSLGSDGIEPHGDRFVQVQRRVNELPRTSELVVVVNWMAQVPR